MLRYALALALGVSIVVVANFSATAQEKKDSKTIEGKMVCGKCTLGETDKCSNVVKVKEGGKDVNYFISDKGNKETYHKGVCPSGKEVDVKVTGKVVEKDGKKTIEDAKVEVKK
jgi:hypothetical protein